MKSKAAKELVQQYVRGYQQTPEDEEEAAACEWSVSALILETFCSNESGRVALGFGQNSQAGEEAVDEE